MTLSLGTHLVDSRNTLRLLDADWTLVLKDGRPAFVPKTSLMGLRPHQGRCRDAVTRVASVNLIPVQQTAFATQPPQMTPSLINVVELRISESCRTEGISGRLNAAACGRASGRRNDSAAVPDTRKHRRVKERARAYLLEDGLLYHEASGGKLCIPASLRPEKGGAQCNLGGGQCGGEKTAAAVASRYYWPRMADSITLWIRGCDVMRDHTDYCKPSPFGWNMPNGMSISTRIPDTMQLQPSLTRRQNESAGSRLEKPNSRRRSSQ